MPHARFSRRPVSPTARRLAAAWRATVAPTLAAALAPVLALAVWQAASQAGWLPGRILPAPSAVAAAAVALAQSGELWEAVRASAQRAIAGLLLGGAAGLVLGMLIVLARRSGARADSLLQALGLAPVLAFAPLILLWLGEGETARLALLALGAFFPVYRQTVRGIRAVDPGLLAIGRACGLHGWPLCLHVILPGALPSILAGVRQAVGLVWLVLVALEFFAAPSGLGHLATHGPDRLRADVLLASIALYAVMSAASGALVHALARYLLRWRPAHRPEILSGAD